MAVSRPTSSRRPSTWPDDPAAGRRSGPRGRRQVAPALPPAAPPPHEGWARTSTRGRRRRRPNSAATSSHGRRARRCRSRPPPALLGPRSAPNAKIPAPLDVPRGRLGATRGGVRRSRRVVAAWSGSEAQNGRERGVASDLRNPCQNGVRESRLRPGEVRVRMARRRRPRGGRGVRGGGALLAGGGKGAGEGGSARAGRSSSAAVCE